MSLKLTFGFPTTSDPNAWMTLNSFRMNHRHLRESTEIVIVDNSHESCDISKELFSHVRANHKGVRYYRDMGPPSSCLYKSRVFEYATGDVVICVDSHVMLERDCVKNVLDYFEANPDSRDLITGPCMNSSETMVATNQQLFAEENYALPGDATVRYGYVCRGGQLGTWVTDPRGLDINGEPFVIRMNGSGFLAMRREAYPGFPDNLWGFGGCEPALYRRVESAGGRVLCHPGCRWVHNFSDAHGRGYRPRAEDKIRNYIVSANAIGDPAMKAAAIEHFATVHPKDIGAAIVQAEQVSSGTFVPQPSRPPGSCKENGSCSRKEAAKANAEPGEAKPKAAPAKAATAKPEGVYDKYIAKWKEVGGDVGGACPKPMFVQIAHFHSQWMNPASGAMEPVRSLELGSGLSTLAFDRQGLIHTAIEHDPKWIARVQPLLTRPTTQVIHAPLKDGWYDWEPPYGTLYHIILIDGPPGSYGRKKCLDIVPRLLAPNGTILIDDTQREEEREISDLLAKQLGMVATRRNHGGRSYDLLLPAPEPMGEGPGTELVRIFSSLKMPSCQQCHNLARRMNKWGEEGCWENMEIIVEDMLPRARMWWKGASPWMKGEAWFKSQGSIWDKMVELRKAAKGKMTGDMDEALRESIRVHVSEAIRSSIEKRAATPPQP